MLLGGSGRSGIQGQEGFCLGCIKISIESRANNARIESHQLNPSNLAQVVAYNIG